MSEIFTLIEKKSLDSSLLSIHMSKKHFEFLFVCLLYVFRHPEIFGKIFKKMKNVYGEKKIYMMLTSFSYKI